MDPSAKVCFEQAGNAADAAALCRQGVRIIIIIILTPWCRVSGIRK